MGYILPINPIQSQQYANRIAMEPYNFATVNRVEQVRFKSDFLKDFEEAVEFAYEEHKKKSDQAPSKSQIYNYIVPNPANLSPAISQIVGKGISVNTYI